MYPETEKTKRRCTKVSKRKKGILAASDLGSWYEQEQQWPELFERTESENKGESTPSTSRRKIETSRIRIESDSSFDSSASFQLSEDESCDSDDSVTLDPEMCKTPRGNYILNANCLQALLDNSAVCKDCSGPLKIKEKIGSRHGWGSKWSFRCSNSFCISCVIFRAFSLPHSRSVKRIVESKTSNLKLFT